MAKSSMKDIVKAIQEGYYESKVPYPGSKPLKPKPLLGKEYNELNKKALKIYEGLISEHNEKVLVYRKEQARLAKEFREDALEYVGLTGHLKADKAFELAWDKGHSSGLYEVLTNLEELAELLI